MKKWRIICIGFGTVGQGLAKILLDKEKLLADRYGFHCEITGICDYNQGSLYSEEGLNIREILRLINNGNKLTDYTSSNNTTIEKELAAETMITKGAVDVVCEATYTDIHTGGAALEHCQTAFKHKKHVVTSNKGPAVVCYNELQTLANQNHCYWGIEGTVMSGTPILNCIRNQLQGIEIQSLSGILNGTCNYILTEMNKDVDYETALRLAQEKGYAEADPTADVAGKDVLAKVVILANVIMGGRLKVNDVSCEGIENITQKKINQAKKEGNVWKLIGEVKRTSNKICAKVAPQKIALEHPLASVNGATNALTVKTDMLDALTIIGPGAGKIETGYALLSDLLTLHELKRRSQ